jgi:hypothetical protein
LHNKILEGRREQMVRGQMLSLALGWTQQLLLIGCLFNFYVLVDTAANE